MRLFITLFICSYLQSTTDEYFKKPKVIESTNILGGSGNKSLRDT